MHHPRQPAQYRQSNVDNEVGAAASLQQDGEGRDEDGEEVEAHVCAGGGHVEELALILPVI